MKRKVKRDDVKGMMVDVGDCAEIAMLLDIAFIWGATKEGEVYWRNVRDRLVEINFKARKLEAKK